MTWLYENVPFGVQIRPQMEHFHTTREEVLQCIDHLTDSMKLNDLVV